MIIYLNGNFCEAADGKVSPFDRGFQYGDGIYDVIKSYSGKLFRFDEHLRRLNNSLQQCRIDFNQSSLLKGIAQELINKNDLINCDASVYIQITRGEYVGRIHSFPPIKTDPTILMISYPIQDRTRELTEGVKIIFEKDIRWLRCDIKTTSILPAVLGNQKAKEASAYEAVWVRDGLLTEGTHTNFFAVKSNSIITAPEGNFILSGITRNAVIELSRNMGLKIREEYLNISEIFNFDEFFLTGTVTEITPVRQIEDKLINNGKPGLLTQKLQKAFLDLVRKEARSIT
ncbi:MAG: aminotransferase class IV [Ignavibacteriaceae bacterium]|nr:aminotransferase class IV [Ignavibacteriaceae bacterium]